MVVKEPQMFFFGDSGSLLLLVRPPDRFHTDSDDGMYVPVEIFWHMANLLSVMPKSKQLQNVLVKVVLPFCNSL